MTTEPAATPPPRLLSTHQDLSAQELQLKGFKAYEVDTAVNPGPTYRRRDFYKVALVTSHCTVHYADRGIELNGTCLMFANPHIPYSIELHAPRLTGYSCLFTEAFMKEDDRSDSLQQSPLFKVGGGATVRKLALLLTNLAAGGCALHLRTKADIVAKKLIVD